MHSKAAVVSLVEQVPDRVMCRMMNVSCYACMDMGCWSSATWSWAPARECLQYLQVAHDCMTAVIACVMAATWQQRGQ